MTSDPEIRERGSFHGDHLASSVVMSSLQQTTAFPDVEQFLQNRFIFNACYSSPLFDVFQGIGFNNLLCHFAGDRLQLSYREQID